MRLTANCDSARHGHRAGVTDAQPPFDNPKFGGRLCSAASKADLRRRTCSARDDHVGESHTASEACAQRLQNSFLGGESTRQPLNPVRPLTDLIDLLPDETTWNQRIAWILDPTPHLRDLHEIDPVPNYVHTPRRPPSLALPDHVPKIATTICPGGRGLPAAMNTLWGQNTP